MGRQAEAGGDEERARRDDAKGTVYGGACRVLGIATNAVHDARATRSSPLSTTSATLQGHLRARCVTPSRLVTCASKRDAQAARARSVLQHQPAFLASAITTDSKLSALFCSCLPGLYRRLFSTMLGKRRRDLTRTPSTSDVGAFNESDALLPPSSSQTSYNGSFLRHSYA